MKKSIVAIGLISLAVLCLIIPLVSAYNGWDFRTAAGQIIQWIQDIFGPFFEVMVGEESFSQYFFARVLVLILLFVIISSVLRKIDVFKRNYAVRVIIAAIVSILGMRYITESAFIQGILLPYGILAVTLAIGLPFIIYFFFIHDSIRTSTGRKFAWIIFIAVFLGMWIDRASEIGNANWVYAIGLTLAALAAGFDGKVHEYFNLQRTSRARRRVIAARHAIVLGDLRELERRWAGTPRADLPNSVRETLDNLVEEERVLRRRLARL